MSRRRRTAVVVALSLLAACVLLMWPAATWLQCRRIRLPEGGKPDAVYVAAGSRDQNRRIEALLAWYETKRGTPPLILVGNDAMKSEWSREEQRNLTRAEWTVKKLAARTDSAIEIVPGSVSGTDGEMQALAAYLEINPRICDVALVTSPFHVRRALQRLMLHTEGRNGVSVIAVAETWRDRMPWIVALELAKMLRDCLGLGR